MVIKLLGNDGTSPAGKQSECKALAAKAQRGFDRMLVRVTGFLYFNKCMCIKFPSGLSLAGWILGPVHCDMITAERVGALTPCLLLPCRQWLLHLPLIDLPSCFIIWKITSKLWSLNYV